MVGWGMRAFGWSILGLAFYAGFVYVLIAFAVEGTVGRQRNELTESLARRQRDVRRAEATAFRLDEFKDAVRENDEQLAGLEGVLPGDASLAGLEAQITEAATRSSVRFQGLTGGAAEEIDFYARLPVELEVRGTLDAVSALMNEVARLDRLLHLRGIQVEREGAVFKATLRLDTYYYLAAPAGP